MLHPYFRMRRSLTVGVREVVINDNGEVLLVRHRYTSGWHFPVSGVEINETTEEASANELQQETRLLLRVGPDYTGPSPNRQSTRATIS